MLLARALFQATPILLLDEPTAHLDLQYQVSLLELVHELAHKDHLAVLVALHDLTSLRIMPGYIALVIVREYQSHGKAQRSLAAQVDQGSVLPARASDPASLFGYPAGITG